MALNIINYKYSSEFNELNRIGFDSFGGVFKVNDNKSQVFAVKKIPFKIEETDKLLKEVYFLSNLSYDFIVQFYDSWTESNYYRGMTLEDDGSNSSIIQDKMSKKPYLMHIKLEYCPLTLDYLIKHTVSYNRIAYYIMSELFYEILLGVKYLHNCKPPVIHRDLKPSNILLTDGNNRKFIKLCDFGLSTFHKFDNQSHTIGLGTFEYMAPEVARSRDYNEKSDIWSLGVVLQRMFQIEVNETKHYDIFPDKYQCLKNIILNKLMFYGACGRPSCEQLLFELSSLLLSCQQIKDFIPHTLEYCPLTLGDLINHTARYNNIAFYIMTELFYEIMLGVNYLLNRSPPVLHRDIKPINILLTNGIDGKFIKLSDFGLSTLHEYHNQLHTIGLGTFGYMAPEVVRSRDYNEKSDIWSLGLVLQKMFQIEINRTTNYDVFPNKHQCLENIILQLMRYKACERPSCEQMLNKLSSLWLSCEQITEIFEDENTVQIISSNNLSVAETFVQSFLNIKLAQS